MVEGIVHTSGINNQHVFPWARLDLGTSPGVVLRALRGIGRTPSLSSDADAIIRGFEHDGTIVVVWHAANRGLDEFALAFANHNDQVGVLPVENRQKPPTS